MTLRDRCTVTRLVFIDAHPARGSIASTIASITTLLRNTISNEPMWRCSSRTAIAIAVNDATAPLIQRTPRSVELIVRGRIRPDRAAVGGVSNRIGGL